MEWFKLFLQEHVDAEKIESITEAFKKELPKHLIPKEVFNDKSDEAKTLREQLVEQKKLMKPLAQKAESLEQYEQKIKEWQAKYTTLETETNEKIQRITKTNTLKDLLVREGADVGLVDLLVEKYSDAAEYDDGKIKNEADLLKQVKEERKSAFVTKTDDTEGDTKQKGTKSEMDDVRLRKAFGLK